MFAVEDSGMLKKFVIKVGHNTLEEAPGAPIVFETVAAAEQYGRRKLEDPDMIKFSVEQYVPKKSVVRRRKRAPQIEYAETQGDAATDG